MAAASPTGDADVWQALHDRLDWSRVRPALAADIEVARFQLRWGDDYAMVANRADLTYYRLEPAEADLLAFMDGTRTVADLAAEHLQHSGELDPDAVTQLVRLLHSTNCLTHRSADVWAALQRAVQPPPKRARLVGFLKTLSIEWFGAERLVRWLYRHGLRWLLRPVSRVLALGVALLGLAAFASVVASHRFHFSTQSLGLGFLLLFSLNLTIIFIHELGHASLLVHHDRRVKSAGFRIYFGAPAFFVDSSDALMADRRQRMAQAFAGPYFELVAAGVASLALWTFPGAAVAPVLFRFTVLNYYVLALNLVPLLELDGYWILSDALGMPQLRPRSLAFVRRELWHKLGRRERFSLPEVGLGLYGLVGVIFTLVSFVAAFFFWRRTFGDLVSRMWHGGPLGLTLLVVLAAFLASPLVRALADAVVVAARRLRALWHRATFRFQRRWRVEAAHLLDALPLFAELPAEVLADLAGRVQLRNYAPGAVIVRQGARADAFYVIRSGRVDVVVQHPGDRERRVRRLGRGMAFGELGLLRGAPRAATVRAHTGVEVFRVTKGDFERLLAGHARLPTLPATLDAAAELGRLGCFVHLEARELMELLRHGRWVDLPAGHAVVRQGQRPDAFYALGAGRVEVLRDGEPVATLGPGAHFGELALLDDGTRRATVRTLSAVRTFRLDRAGFDRLVAGTLRFAPMADAASNRAWDH